MGIKYSEAYGNSKLVINEFKGKYEVRIENLVLDHLAPVA